MNGTWTSFRQTNWWAVDYIITWLWVNGRRVCLSARCPVTKWTSTHLRLWVKCGTSECGKLNVKCKMQNDGDCPHVRPHDCSYYAVYCKVCNPHVASVTTNMQHNPLHINISCLVVDIWQISALCILRSIQQLHSTFCTSTFYFPHFTFCIIPTAHLVAEWLACWTRAHKGLGSNHSLDAVG